MAFGRRDLFRLGAIGGAFGVAGALAYPMTRWFGSRSARLTQSQAGLAATQGPIRPNCRSTARVIHRRHRQAVTLHASNLRRM